MQTQSYIGMRQSRGANELLAPTTKYGDRRDAIQVVDGFDEPFVEPTPRIAFAPLIRNPLTDDIAVTLVLMDGFDLHDLAVLSDCFELYNRLSEQRLFRLSLAGVSSDQVNSSCGVVLRVSRSIASLGAGENVFLLGCNAEGAGDVAIGEWVESRLELPGSITGIGDACRIFAALDAMRNVPLAAHWQILPEIQTAFPSCRVVHALAVIVNRVMTCCGRGATLDLALHCIASVGGQAIARSVGYHLSHREPRKLSRGQRVTSSIDHEGCPEIVKQAIRLMTERIADPVSINYIANHTGTTVRQVERLFRRHLGETPARLYQKYRLRCARRLVLQTLLPMTQIARETGFGTPNYFSACYRRMFGMRPTRERKTSALPERRMAFGQ